MKNSSFSNKSILAFISNPGVDSNIFFEVVISLAMPFMNYMVLIVNFFIILNIQKPKYSRIEC